MNLNKKNNNDNKNYNKDNNKNDENLIIKIFILGKIGNFKKFF
jgi:hypothetical protein